MSRSLLSLVGGLILLGIVALVGGDHGSSLWPFVGRFHPLMVHLPIGILLIAMLAEWVGRVTARHDALQLVPFALLVGGWSAIAAAIVGVVLSDWGSYDPVVLLWHRRLGLLVPVLATLAYWLRGRASMSHAGVVIGVPSGAPVRDPSAPASAQSNALMRPSGGARPNAHVAYFAACASLLGAVTVGGHLGGTLSRGDGYLTRHLPEGVRLAVGLPGEAAVARIPISNADTTPVFGSLIQPILTSRCGACHNPERKKGGLVLTSAEGVFAGGRQGKVVVAGRADDSEMLIRLALPPGHTDAMPPDRPIPMAEVSLIRWWIEEGASVDVRLSAIERPASVRRTLAAYGLDDLPTGIFALAADVADTSAVAAARKTGLVVQPLGASVSYLSVDATNVPSEWNAASLESLRPLSAVVASVNLAHTSAGDSSLVLLGDMPHLTHLRLAQTKVSDAGLESLKKLSYLEYLNLVDTNIGDVGLRALEGLSRLRTVYLWGTHATEGGVARLKRALPRATITLGAPPLLDPAAKPARVPSTSTPR